MTNNAKEILNKIKQNKTAYEICNELNISRKKLMYYLKLIKNEGQVIRNTYVGNGDIIFNNSFPNDINNYIKNIPYIVPTNGEIRIKCVAISDLHIGNTKQRLDLLEQVYNYCIKNDIHIILCCGDIINGLKGNTITQNTIKQINTFLKYYPYDPSITTFAVLGENDFTSIHTYHFDPKVKIEKERNDIVICGYNCAKIFMANTPITLHHYIRNERPILDTPIILEGHTHRFNIRGDDQVLIKLPALCDIDERIPAAAEIHFNTPINKNGNYTTVNHVDLYQLISYNNELQTINSLSYKVNNEMNFGEQKILK